MRRLIKFFLLTVFICLYPYLYFFLNETSKLLGYRQISVNVLGTGSMYPSFYWSKSQGGPEDSQHDLIYSFRAHPLMYRFINNKTTLHHGDIIAFHSNKTKQLLHQQHQDSAAGFIKRVIALPGDILEIKNGFVFLNGQILSEPYIFKPRSTYGGKFLSDCQSLKIPAGHVFVMGDNRKASLDSRHDLGLVAITDINYILPYTQQDNYRFLWRDASHDAQFANQPTLEIHQFINLLNQKRRALHLPALKLQTQLTHSAKIRAQSLLSNQHLDLTATTEQAGYHNIILSEFVVRGFYTAQELLQGLEANSKTKNQLYNPNLTDIGLAVILQDQSTCPQQIIVGHLGGYLPPNYDSQIIASWKQLLDNLNQVIPSWENARHYSFINQDKLNQLLQILYQRRSLAQDIYQTMIQNKWLTQQQQDKIKLDQQWAQQAQQLIQELNNP